MVMDTCVLMFAYEIWLQFVMTMSQLLLRRIVRAGDLCLACLKAYGMRLVHEVVVLFQKFYSNGVGCLGFPPFCFARLLFWRGN